MRPTDTSKAGIFFVLVLIENLSISLLLKAIQYFLTGQSVHFGFFGLHI